MRNLLETLIIDEKKTNRKLYSSGPIWDYKNKKSIYQLKKKSINNFRGLNSGVATSFSDNLVYDIRNEYNWRGRLVSKFLSIPIIKSVFNSQLKVTLNHIENLIKYQATAYENNDRVFELLNKYNFENTTEFGCVQKFSKNNKEYSVNYVEMAHRIENLSKIFDFNKINTFFEIGGGFGSNIHFLLQNFKNIKKVVFLETVPNILVATEYLRFFYQNCVIDYIDTKKNKKISFEKNNQLEIICIPPWEIEKLDIEIDHFHNAHSFVEMPLNVLKNYSHHLIKNKTKQISLVSYYDNSSKKTYDPKKSIDASKLNEFFNNKLNSNIHQRVLGKYGRKDIYLTANL